MLSFLRHGVDADGNPTVLACVANFSGGPREDYRVGLPFAGRWREVLNTDAEIYGGSGVGNLGVVEAEPQMWHGRPASAALRLPPTGVLWLAPERSVQDEIGAEQAADIGQAAAVAPFAPEVVGDTTSAITVPDSPAALTDMPSAGVGGTAPVVAPDVPEVEVAPLGTSADQGKADQVPPGAAGEGSAGVPRVPSATGPADRDDESSTHQ